MNNLYPMAKNVGMVIMLGLVLFVLQGCTKPFVSVVVEVDGCCKTGECSPGEPRDPVQGCGAPTPVTTPIQHDGILCNTGFICSAEGVTCSRGKKCDTQYTSGSTTNCTCACVRNPD